MMVREEMMGDRERGGVDHLLHLMTANWSWNHVLSLLPPGHNKMTQGNVIHTDILRHSHNTGESMFVVQLKHRLCYSKLL